MSTETVTLAWDEAAHPRAPAGDPTGGQFEPADKQTTRRKEGERQERKPRDPYAGPNMSYDPNSRRGPGYGQRDGDRRVKLLQQVLNRLGLRDAKGNKLDVDGKLGPLTTQAIKVAQRRLGVPANGVVTPQLLKRLAETPAHLREGGARREAEKGQRRAAADVVIAFDSEGHPQVPNVLWDWRAAMALSENWEDQPRDWKGRWVASPPKPAGVSELLPPRTLRRVRPSFEEKDRFNRQVKKLSNIRRAGIDAPTQQEETVKAFPEVLVGAHQPAARYQYNKETINRKLRGGDTQFPLTDFEQETISGLDDLLRDPKNRTSRDTLVYRGVSNMKDVFGSEWCSNCSMSTYEGLSWVERGFANASEDDDVAEKQARGTDAAILNIVVPQGSSALAIKDYVSGRKKVKDLVFPRDARFRIVSASRDDKGRLQLNVAVEADPGLTAAALEREKDVNVPGQGHNLRNYWVRGPGAAKIGWGTDGSFARCVAQLGEYVKDPQGLCAEYHKAATGEWPAEKGVESGAGTETFHAGERHYEADECPPGHHRMPNGECMADEEMEAVVAADKQPYGDVAYADPGYQEDGVKRYPIDTEEHVRAAWSYINQADNAARYSATNLRKVRARIKAAMKRFGIGSGGDEDTTASALEVRAVMPWRIERREGAFVVLADADDSLAGEFTNRSGAVTLLRRLYAQHAGLEETVVAAAEAVIETTPVAHTAPWNGVLTVEGIESGDGRMFGANGLSWDEPPLPLMWQKETSHGGNTDKSVRVGSITKIWREPDASGRADVFLIKGEGHLDLDNPDGAEVHRRMDNGDMRGNSVDVDSIKGADVELVYPEVGEGAGTESLLTQAFAQPELTIYRKGRIRATTMVEIPAFTEARLELVRSTAVTASSDCRECGEIVVEDADGQRWAALTAATATIEVPDLPPREWFEEPVDVAMDGALTVTAEGRIYGMVAPAGVRHRSFTQRAQYVPLGRVDYGRYHGGQTPVADGGRVSTGNITMDCGHATTAVRLTGQQASEHYDNTCSIVATACVGENERGVWIAGALLPDVDAATVRRMMACRLSGDWRTHLDRAGWREFVAALLVPVPGFPMARTSPSVEVSDGELVASSVPVQLVVNDQPISLRAVRRDRVTELVARVGRDVGSRRLAAVARVRSHRVAALSHRVQSFHGTHDQSTHGNRRGGGGGGGGTSFRKPLKSEVPAEAGDFSGPNWAASWAEQQREQYPDVKLSVTGGGGKKITVHSIVVPKEKRNEGIGGRIMRDLLKHADRNGDTVTLDPSSSFGGSVPKLKRWYKSLGFVENKGSNRDFEISEDMYRLPKSEK